jgi:hypothetical protein
MAVSNWVMSNKAWNGIAIIFLIGSSSVYGNRTVLSIVSASHLVRHGDEIRESRVHLMRDHKLYVRRLSSNHLLNRPAQCLALCYLNLPFSKLKR